MSGLIGARKSEKFLALACSRSHSLIKCPAVPGKSCHLGKKGRELQLQLRQFEEFELSTFSFASSLCGEYRLQTKEILPIF